MLSSACSSEKCLDSHHTPAVLLVEKEYSFRLLLKLWIEHHYGYRVITANDDESAVELALDEHPDFILLDLNLKKSDDWGLSNGFETISRFHQFPEIEDVPMLAFSDLCWDRDIHNRVRDIGGVAYVDKGYIYEQLARFLPSMRQELVAE